MIRRISALTRRSFLRYATALGGAACLSRVLPSYAAPYLIPVDGRRTARRTIDLRIAEETITVGDRTTRATAINGTVPGPLLRFREGETVSLRVLNELNDETSIHWHGILLPFDMDGVPQVSFAGIQPGEMFHYSYRVQQSGTYWYHSHSGFQEQTGTYGPINLGDWLCDGGGRSCEAEQSPESDRTIATTCLEPHLTLN